MQATCLVSVYTLGAAETHGLDTVGASRDLLKEIFPYIDEGTRSTIICELHNKSLGLLDQALQSG